MTIKLLDHYQIIHPNLVKQRNNVGIGHAYATRRYRTANTRLVACSMDVDITQPRVAVSVPINTRFKTIEPKNTGGDLVSISNVKIGRYLTARRASLENHT